MATRTEIIELISILQEESPGSKDMSDKRKEVWIKKLCGFDIKELEKAVEDVIASKTDNFMPPLGTVLAKLEGSEKENLEELTELALITIEEAMRKAGTRNGVLFEDPVITRTIEAMSGGWPGLGMVHTDKWEWVKKDLAKKYKLFYKQKDSLEVNKETRGSNCNGFGYRIIRIESIKAGEPKPKSLLENHNDFVRGQALEPPKQTREEGKAEAKQFFEKVGFDVSKLGVK